MLDRRGALLTGFAATATAALPGFAAAQGRQAQIADAVPRRSVRLAEGWRFHLGHASDMARDFGFGRNQRSFAKAGTGTADAAMPRFDDSGWQTVAVPHDWAVDLPYAPPTEPAAKDEADAVAAHGFRAIGRDHPANSVGWYRIPLPVGREDAGRSVWLEFDGVFRDSIVFVNGYIVGGSASGYAPFGVDISDFLDYDGGPNLLALRVDASLGEGWFYEGAGIYRHVTLISAAQIHVPMWGVCVRSEIAGSAATLSIAVDLANGAAGDGNGSIRHSIVAADGRTAATIAPIDSPVPGRGQVTTQAACRLTAPRLWSLEDPHVYRLITEILVDGQVVDRVETPFGIRSIAFEPDKGFFLNGRSVKLLGTCNHQDHAGVGIAIPDALHAWRVLQLKEMGVNAWRSAHNPPAQTLLDLCDRMGMLMVAEARLNSSSTEAMDELERMVRSCRNHPSVILWSLGNEEPQQGSERGRRITAAMAAKVKALDPTRFTTQAFDMHFGEGASLAVDVVGFNYRTDKIAAFHAAHPHLPVIGTETGSTVATRGAYVNDAKRHVARAYDTEYPWWANSAEQWWPIVADSPYIAGGFIWTGFDYRGEPTPFPAWPSVSSYFGVLDLCGFPKDNYFYYRAWWRPEDPLVHLLPHWNWAGREGEPIEVWAYGNCDEIELLLNGHSLGRQGMPRYGHVLWQVPYAPGVIEARGYRGGRQVAQDRRVTAAEAAALRLSADRRRYSANGTDVAVVRVEVIDRHGNIAPTAGNAVAFEVTGPGRLIGTGNGDPTDHAPDHGGSRNAFNGLAQLLVQAGRAPGAIRIAARSPGLGEASLILFAHSPEESAR
ncbi:beta-galactosidase GalA [Flavisphingomonas formosensis]|uniref:beta-galactosidase GalA n=1 Tax=Flavisphingomonas formosensis TaxID=861534 RepID=UPI0012F9487C|nr:beta-galactosidase GalA [Sphingomonas formosensis]